LKRLVDENLAPGLAEQLADLFPGSIHVTAAGLGSTSDTVNRGVRRGQSVYVPDQGQGLLQTGNCSTSQIESIIRSNAVRFSEFDNDSRRILLLLK